MAERAPAAARRIRQTSIIPEECGKYGMVGSDPVRGRIRPKTAGAAEACTPRYWTQHDALACRFIRARGAEGNKYRGGAGRIAADKEQRAMIKVLVRKRGGASASLSEGRRSVGELFIWRSFLGEDADSNSSRRLSTADFH